MTTQSHQLEIARTRVGGFGGSDAAMFFRIGKNGIDALTHTDKKRILVAKGLADFEPTPQNAAMRGGHLFEDYQRDYNADLRHFDREVKLSANLTNRFDTFCHADFSINANNEIAVRECKFSQKSTDEVLATYMPQLQWYFLMGAESVRLIHGWGNVEPFEVADFVEVEVYKYSDILDMLIIGINTLADHWEDINLTLRDDITVNDLLPFDASMVQAMTDVVTEIKRLETEADTYKKKLLQLFEDNGIKSLNSENYVITYVEPMTRTTLDKTKLIAANPQIDVSKYEKISHVKSSLKIKLK